jgi:hypothetical protein
MRHTHDPDGTRLPIKLDSTANGDLAMPCHAKHLARRGG